MNPTPHSHPPLHLPPPPTLVPVRPNLGNWAQHDHHRLRDALGRIPSWDIPSLAAVIGKPLVEVVWHLSTVHAATLAAHQAPDVALNPLQALLVGFNLPVVNGVERKANESNCADGTEEEEQSANEWESDEDEDDEHEHERQHPSLYAQESNKSTITREEEASARLGRNLDKLVAQLNLERPLSRLNKRKVNVFYRSRMAKIMSHHLNNATPLTILNDTWLDLHTHLAHFIRTRLAAAYNHAYARLQAAHRHGTHIVVDQITLEDMYVALMQCATASMPHGVARARADRERTAELAHWWHTEYLPLNPGVREEMGIKIERMFRERGIEWRAVRTWKPKEDMLARLDHVFVKARRARMRAKSRAAAKASVDEGSVGESSNEGSTDPEWSESDDESGSGLPLAEFEWTRRWLDAAAVAEPIKVPNPQGLFHVDALISIQDDLLEEEEEVVVDEDELDDDSSTDGQDGHGGDSDHDDELELDADGLPRSGQRPSTRPPPPRSPTPSSPPPLSLAPFQTPAPLRSLHPSQFATPAAAVTPGTRRRPIRYRVGVDAADGDPMDLDEPPPSVLRSSRRAKRPLPPDDESPSRSTVRASRWEDAGAAAVDGGEEEGGDQEEQDDDSRLSDDGAGEAQAASGSWNGRSVKRARFV